MPLRLMSRATRLLVASLLASSLGLAIWVSHVLDPDDTHPTGGDPALTETESSVTEISQEPTKEAQHATSPPGMALRSGGTPNPSSPAIPGAAAGIRVYRDPKTGKFGVPPTGSAARRLSPPLQSALSRSDEDLEEVYSDTPAGGVVVDLRGRFLAPVVATLDADGKVSVRCLHGLEADARKR